MRDHPYDRRGGRKGGGLSGPLYAPQFRLVLERVIPLDSLLVPAHWDERTKGGLRGIRCNEAGRGRVSEGTCQSWNTQDWAPGRAWIITYFRPNTHLKGLRKMAVRDRRKISVWTYTGRRTERIFPQLFRGRIRILLFHANAIYFTKTLRYMFFRSEHSFEVKVQ
jgi:hypothetical protein